MPTSSMHVTALARAVTASVHWTDETPRLAVQVQSPHGTVVKIVAKALAATRCGTIQRGDCLEIEGTWDPVHQRVIASRLINLGPLQRRVEVPVWTSRPNTPAGRAAFLEELRAASRRRFRRFAPQRA
jgi:hypothetical protein